MFCLWSCVHLQIKIKMQLCKRRTAVHTVIKVQNLTAVKSGWTLAHLTTSTVGWILPWKCSVYTTIVWLILCRKYCIQTWGVIHAVCIENGDKYDEIQQQRLSNAAVRAPAKLSANQKPGRRWCSIFILADSEYGQKGALNYCAFFFMKMYQDSRNT